LGNTNQIAAEFLKAIILFIIGSLSFAFNIQAQQVLDNGKLRMGTGLEPSINNTGNLQQPFYFNGEQNAWRALTYSTYPLDNAFGVGGDKTHEWNVNGTIVASPLMSNQVIDASGFVITSGQKGYGTITTTGNITIGSQYLQVKNTYFLPQNSSYLKVTTKVKNINSTYLENVRIWIGTRDDWVGLSDAVRKQKGNLIENSFVPNVSKSSLSLALKISTADEGVLFYTNSDKGNIIVHPRYGSFHDRIVLTDPGTSSLDTTTDGAYGFYVRMKDLLPAASDSFTWYYAAGELGQLENIIQEVATMSGAVNNIAYTTANLTGLTEEKSTGYWMIVPRDAVAPTQTQIRAGDNYGSVFIHSSGSRAMIANQETAFPLSSLSPGTRYDLYFVSEDEDHAFSSILKVSFSTLAYQVPTVSTGALTDISDTSATSQINVSNDGDQDVTAVGMLWSTSGTPTINDNKTIDGAGLGVLSSTVSELLPNTIYYLRAYAINSVGVGYGSTRVVKTSPGIPTITASVNPVCLGGSTVLTASGGNGITVYWYADSCSSTLLKTGNSITVTSVTNTTYFARNYNGRFSNGCGSFTVQPVISGVSGPTLVCENNSVELWATTGFNSYQWYKDGVRVAGGGAGTHSSLFTTEGGNYKVIGFTSGGSCTSQIFQLTKVKAPLLEVWETKATKLDSTHYQSCGPVTLSPKANYFSSVPHPEAPVSFDITYDDGTSELVTGNVLMLLKTGMVRLNLNSITCSSSFSIHVKVDEAIAKPLITASGPTSFCLGGSVTLTASEGKKYLWSTGAETRSITVSSSGEYNVTVRSNTGCSATSDNTTVMITTTSND